MVGGFFSFFFFFVRGLSYFCFVLVWVAVGNIRFFAARSWGQRATRFISNWRTSRVSKMNSVASANNNASKKEPSSVVGERAVSGAADESPPLAWEQLQDLVKKSFEPADVVRGPANAHTRTRLFDAPDGTVPDVVLYRDNHYWCPYCEKLQLYLEAKRIPYTIRLVTMFCYGKKEPWYKRVVPSGMLPALSLTPDGRIITESDDIMVALERK